MTKKVSKSVESQSKRRASTRRTTRVLRAAFSVPLIFVLTLSCASKPPSNPADTLTVFNLEETRLNKEPANILNEGALSVPSWLVLKPGVLAYVKEASVACPTSHLRAIISASLAAFDKHRTECRSLAKIVVVTVDEMFHVHGDDYVVKARSPDGTSVYVGGGDLAPVIPNGTPLAVSTDAPDCGGSDNPPCGVELVDGSGNVICTLAGGETVRVLDFQPPFEHQLHVEIENGAACPHAKGYMDELFVEGGVQALFGFADVAQANQRTARVTTGKMSSQP